MNWYWVTGAFIENLLILLIGFSLLKIKWRYRLGRIVAVSFFMAMCYFVLKMSFPPTFYLPVSIVLNCLLLHFIMNINYFLSLLTLPVGSILMLTINVIMFSIFDGHLAIGYIYAFIFIIAIVLILVINKFHLHFQIPNTIKKLKGEFNQLKWILLLAATYLVHFLLLSIVNSSMQKERMQLTVISISCILLGFFIVKRGYEYKLKHLETSINAAYDKEFIQYLDLLQMQRHYGLDQLLRIRMLLEIGHLQATKEYLDELIDTATLNSDVAKIESHMAAGILQFYKGYAAQRDISLHLDIQDSLSSLPCNTYEIHKLLKTLIQHAIDDCEKLPLKERKIDLKIIKIEGKLQIELYHMTDLTRTEEIDISHPISKSIKEIVGKYHGKLISKMVQNGMHVQVSIPLER